jgi:tetratricopeptide (TPR) repeat protein
MLRSLNILLKKVVSRGADPGVGDPNRVGLIPSSAAEAAAGEEATPAPSRTSSEKAAFLMGRGEWQEAIKAWNEAAEQAVSGGAENSDTRWLFAWSKLQVAICQWHLEDYAQSYLTLRLTVAFDRRILPLRETRLLRARLTGLVSKDRSAAYLARGIAVFPEDYALLFDYVKCLIALKRWETAQDNVELLYAMAPSDPPVQEMMQKIRLRSADQRS